MRRCILLAVGLAAAACRPQQAIPPCASGGPIDIDPVVAISHEISSAGARVTNRGSTTMVVCSGPVVKSATDSASGAVLIETLPIAQHQEPKVEKLCALEWAILLDAGEAATVVDVFELLDARNVDVTVTVTYWTFDERKAHVVERTFKSVAVRESTDGQPVSPGAACK